MEITRMGYIRLYKDYLGRMEKKVETTGFSVEKEWRGKWKLL